VNRGLFENVSVDYVPGKRAVLTILRDQEEEEKIELTDLNYSALEELFVGKGFKINEEIKLSHDGVDEDDEDDDDDDDDDDELDDDDDDEFDDIFDDEFDDDNEFDDDDEFDDDESDDHDGDDHDGDDKIDHQPVEEEL